MRPMLGVSVVDGKVIFDGLAWYIIQCLQQSLRFKTQLQTTDEQIWSSRRSTGEWGGPLGMLERNESDITAHPVIPTADRLTVGTPLPASMYSNPRYYAGTPNAYMTSVFGYLMSFDLEDLNYDTLLLRMLAGFFEWAVWARRIWDYAPPLESIVRGEHTSPQTPHEIAGVARQE
ncbi:uncharacterized protein [Dermacentor albipictus]|uniref:uncharacterized protein n=1 Tax=Dermacentor albipictus TaxID=60249 RepID=UPI0038FCA3A7